MNDSRVLTLLIQIIYCFVNRYASAARGCVIITFCYAQALLQGFIAYLLKRFLTVDTTDRYQRRSKTNDSPYRFRP